MLIHLGPVGYFADRLKEFVPAVILNVFLQGHLGVPVFFVISGFVIAYSQRGIYITPNFLGNFALRRSLRLDPPYWVTMVLILFLNALLNPMRPPGHEIPFPGWQAIIANLFYAHDLLHYRSICGVSWTLCYEVQFYLVFSIMMGIAQRLPLANRRLAGVQHGSQILVFAPLGLLSIACWMGWVAVPNGLFVDKWFAFFVGVMAWAVVERSISAAWLWIYLACIGASWIMAPCPYHDLGCWWMPAVVLTGIAIHVAASLGRMETWLSNRWLQFLGRISYSLYLIHAPVGVTITAFGVRHSGGSNVLVLAWIAVAIAASIASAYLMYRFIERPMVQLGKRFKWLPPNSPAVKLAPPRMHLHASHASSNL